MKKYKYEKNSLYDLAKFILEYNLSMKEFIQINNLLLNKIIFYIYGYYLVIKGQCLFPYCDIVKWPYGPCIIDLYYEYNIYGAYPIDFTVKSTSKSQTSFYQIFDPDDEYFFKELFNFIANKYKNKNFKKNFLTTRFPEAAIFDRHVINDKIGIETVKKYFKYDPIGYKNKYY